MLKVVLNSLHDCKLDLDEEEDCTDAENNLQILDVVK